MDLRRSAPKSAQQDVGTIAPIILTSRIVLALLAVAALLLHGCALFNSASQSDPEVHRHPEAAPQRRFVDAIVPASGNGQNWTNAYRTLAEALAAASTSTEITEIWVAEGTYSPLPAGGSTSSFPLVPGMTLYGGFVSGQSHLEERAVDLHPSILTGDLGPDAAGPVRHVVLGADNATLDGFTITQGHARGDTIDEKGGGGVWIQGGTMTVRGCRFDNNTADSDGGAILVKAGTLSVSDSVFIGNHANNGSGIHSIDSTVKIRRCTFQDNIGLGGTSLGGGVATYQTTAWIERCRFIGNSAGEHGGGLWGDRSSMFVVGCAFSDNSARWGAATSIYMSTADIANCVFSDNHCAIANASVNECGAGAINSNSNGDGDVRVVNCTMVGNVALVSSLPVAGAIILNNTKDDYRNCIFWDNHIEASQLYGHVLRILSNAAMRLDHSLFDGAFSGYWVVSASYLIDLGGNHTGASTAGFIDDADPDGPDNLLGSADDGLHLLSTSPAAGTGLSSALEELGTTPERIEALNLDAAGEPRIPGGSINMGAYQMTIPAGSS